MDPTRMELPLHWRQSTAGEYFAEAFGCFILISLGDGVVAMLWALIGSGRSSAGALQSSGDWLLITWGWFLAVMLAVYTVGGITGAHINPAITLGQAIRRNINDYFWIPIVGPLLGATIAAPVYDIFVQDILKARRRPAAGLDSEGEVVEETPPSPTNDL